MTMAITEATCQMGRLVFETFMARDSGPISFADSRAWAAKGAPDDDSRTLSSQIDWPWTPIDETNIVLLNRV